MIKPIFKRAKPEDVEEVLSFIQAYYAFDDIPFRPAEVAAALRVLLSDLSLGQVWIIGAEEKAVGYTILTFGYDLEFGGSVATVTELYIQPSFRRRGIGRQAIQFLENICRDLEITGLELQVERDNPEAQEFYRSLGFQAHERIPLSKRLVTPTNVA
jgi:ribosomal protein S18 acetylase RimI-like enzyme